jgi:hypothetical protein
MQAPVTESVDEVLWRVSAVLAALVRGVLAHLILRHVDQ